MSALSELGEFIREQRRNAQISLRQLAQQTGVSNPYLSQIERGLRRPSAEVLQQIGNALRISTPVMYLRAGLLEAKESGGVVAALASDDILNDRQKHIMLEIYETFRRENGAAAPVADAAADSAATARSSGQPTGADGAAHPVEEP
jgi:transcriptional regulator with XRE-family HTH domain